MATGSLGQGLSIAAGMAYCGKYYDKARYILHIYFRIGVWMNCIEMAGERVRESERERERERERFFLTILHFIYISRLSLLVLATVSTA